MRFGFSKISWLVKVSRSVMVAVVRTKSKLGFGFDGVAVLKANMFSSSEEVRAAVAKHKDATPDILRVLVADPQADVTANVVLNPNFLTQDYDRIPVHRQYLLNDLAHDPDTSVDKLMFLAKSEYVTIPGLPDSLVYNSSSTSGVFDALLLNEENFMKNYVLSSGEASWAAVLELLRDTAEYDANLLSTYINALSSDYEPEIRAFLGTSLTVEGLPFSWLKKMLPEYVKGL